MASTGTGWDPWTCREPGLGEPGSARSAQTRPLSAATTLGTRCTLSSSEFPFSVFVSFLLTLFPSGIKGWMGPMVTGWCEQPDPTVGWQRAEHSSTQHPPVPVPSEGENPPRVPRALPESGAGSRNLLSRSCTRFPWHSPGAACSGRSPGAGARSGASSGRRRMHRPPASSDRGAVTLAGRELTPPLAQPERLRLLQPSCRRRRRAQPLGPDPATQEPRAS